MSSNAKNLRKKMLRQPGFQFGGQRDIFNSSQAAGRVYAAFLGDADPNDRRTNPEALSAHVYTSVMQLFELCPSRIPLYKALRGSNVFWDTVASEWPINVDPADTCEVVHVFLHARQASQSNDVTSLTNVVDQWHVVANEVALMPDAPTVRLAFRPKMISAAATELQGLQVSHVWPPKGFNGQELWLADRFAHSRQASQR
ncbi:hypothetical protein F5Y15DRAFT_420261 [Xylariaceae sp. FL0016]|nr:hypothetical protein F5Y15DRAFT_420261 [Xylariaceae sp. FL0016]